MVERLAGGMATGEATGEANGPTTTLLGRPAAGYLDEAAGALAVVKREILRRLELAPGQRVLDVGCGNGTDLLDMAAQVDPGGEAIGVDVNPEAIEEATARCEATGVPATFTTASAYSLPFSDDRFDACRSERMVQHLDEPVRAVAEMLRVARPGGRILVADPDHGMWAPDLDDQEATRAVLAWWFDNVRNPWIGRRLPGVLRAAGVREVQVTVAPVVLNGLAAADGLTGLLNAVRQAGERGVIAPDRARVLQEQITAREAEGGFLMYGTIVLAEGRKALP
ncbi:methyltransferase domain-containing protein [Actinomadura alba]|uniref:Methyltransferase domain-containing protein n=1 Tax=Actinomadura alba TaxID=406431 RepID=A0ABR7LVC8_9ACTN|nr:methyltransferase domain-containing protein [Actinomadura alba]MBC6468373.1 methyltransferase domain-containing protein [Actinomadura alba]